jgi:hypothetical protein
MSSVRTFPGTSTRQRSKKRKKHTTSLNVDVYEASLLLEVVLSPVKELVLEVTDQETTTRVNVRKGNSQLVVTIRCSQVGNHVPVH